MPSTIFTTILMVNFPFLRLFNNYQTEKINKTYSHEIDKLTHEI